MRLISLAVCLLVAFPGRAAASEPLAKPGTLLEQRSEPAIAQQWGSRLDAASSRRGSVPYDPRGVQRV